MEVPVDRLQSILENSADHFALLIGPIYPVIDVVRCYWSSCFRLNVKSISLQLSVKVSTQRGANISPTLLDLMWICVSPQISSGHAFPRLLPNAGNQDLKRYGKLGW